MEEYRSVNKPVEVGDIIEITIEGTGAKGDGIGKIEGFVVIVPNANEGDTVKVKITRVLRKMAFGELVEGDASSAEEAPMEAEETQEEVVEEASAEMQSEE